MQMDGMRAATRVPKRAGSRADWWDWLTAERKVGMIWMASATAAMWGPMKVGWRVVERASWMDVLMAA